jgi:uncharacterized protein
MYNLQDSTYRDQPRVMSEAVRVALTDRICRHARRHNLQRVHVILHGGEPLLMGKRHLRDWVENVRAGLSSVVEPAFSMQSNAVLVDAEWIDLLADLEVRIGISIDGPRAFHDRYRVDRHGRGSFDRVIEAIRLLQEHPRGASVFSTVMAVVNPDLDPVELFEFWQYLDTPGFDLSLPHANHAHPPPKGRWPYGAWMIRFFDLWWDQNRSDRHVRYFENMLRMFFGYPFSTDNIGGKAVDVIVVETDGSVEATDAFKSCFEGATKLGLNVLHDDLDSLAGSEFVRALQLGSEALCDQCQACALRNICGGGYMPHRFAVQNGFDNPSVYCADLTELLVHMRGRIDSALKADGVFIG